VDRGRYKVIEFGVPYKRLVHALRVASERSGCQALGFMDMTAAEISRRTLLPLEQAELAKLREYDEPFEIMCGVTHTLLSAIEEQGYRWSRGGRFYHVNGHADKCQAVERLTELYRQACAELTTVGIGDAHNDERFLNAVDRPIIVHSPFAPAIKRAVPKGRVTSAPGPYGWSEAVLGLTAKTLAAT
jgi:mannosyl-3-phosphoglycerate phosphatase